MQATDKIVAALRTSADGKGWVRGLRERMLRYGIPTVIDGSTRKERIVLTIRYAASAEEGRAGALVAELLRGGLARIIATEEGAVRDQPSSAGKAGKVRAVRLDDATWARCRAEGDASVVIRAALELYFNRRNP